ncbi:glycosyl transferase [Companilactobacillus sp. RD055328]|uniref:glycosyltransferase family 2 protein n=1 Tax=Companilactobacillus sp. RD055328 TaxID=2916634 RepID=UPI001FC8A11C|nr:glycosyltransferase family 2 protein [Companilactobacillus sp. RD055328]GKQ42393.1 glycosyl transferase [Companilactobacillus sp. RD055328]
MKKLTIVVPAFNEEEMLPISMNKLLEIEDRLIKDELITSDSDVMVVNDGSKDKTWEVITKLHKENSRIKGIKFSRNFGHQNALIAGLDIAIKETDMIVTIDADLQDDPEAIIEMVKKANEGTDIVYAVRNNRDTDSWFKKNTAGAFYKFLNLLGVKLVDNHADFRLMTKRAVETLLSYKERNLFLRGLVPLLGYKTDKIYYKRGTREAGETKYPLKKMLSFAWEGLTSFSIAPVRLISIFGILASLVGVFMLIYTVITKLMGDTSQGWSSLMISIWMLGGLQMLSLGVIGEYIGKITLEVKNRPRYIIEEILK